MYNNYKQLTRSWSVWLVGLIVLLGSQGAAAQSGPVGNEWIVPGQQYYKVKIARDGLYKLDYQYLTQAGLSGAAPNQLQVWRRGREIATYLGGNQAVLDATTFLEFYAVHNDAKLDAELYKSPQDQAHQYFSFYTDTASYFITWKAGVMGRRMAEPVVAGGMPHPHRLQSKLDMRINIFRDFPVDDINFLPWVQAGEGFFMGDSNNGANELTYTVDSVAVSPFATGPPPRVEVLLFGAPNLRIRFGGVGIQHKTQVIVVPPTGSPRVLGTMTYTGLVRARQSFPMLASDISSTGTVTITLKSQVPVAAGDYFYVGYLRTTAPQANTWYANRRRIFFENDSLLGGPATYEVSGAPATVAGFDVQDLYNVQRIAGTPGASPTLRRFVFPTANASATHQLLLADEAVPLVPLPARQVRFRAINPAAATFIIITHPQLMQPAAGAGNAARAYAAYRASAAGGRYDTLMVTTQQLYDQFNYGEKSWLGLRHFARWMAVASPVGSSRYLFLLGKGIVPNEPIARAFFARYGEGGLDLVPTSSRSVSDNLLTADYVNNDFTARLNTGRLTATTPAQVLTYLAKMREYDALGDQPWRKNVLHLIGGETPDEFVRFRGYMDKYKQHVESPLFGGKVATVERTSLNGTGQSLIVRTNIAPYLNPGLGLISYFGHGSNTSFALDIGDVNDPSNGYNNTNGKYPVLLFNGCAAGQLFTSSATFFENWLFAPGKGAIGAMGETGFSYDGYLDPAQDTLTRLLFNDPRWYGKPVTAVYNETVRRLQRVPGGLFNNPGDGIAVEQLLCTVWHGDPTIALYSPPKPDFQVSSATLSIAPTVAGQTVAASSPDFLLNIGVSNPGKVTREPVEIRITRIFDPNTTPRLPDAVITKTFAQGAQGSATYSVLIPNPAGVNVFGNNTFRVEVDYQNKVDESNETNNTAQISYTFLRGGLTVLNPVEFAIVGTNRPRLVAQTNDPNGGVRGYEFEADTTTSFNSGLKQVSGPITATLTPGWQPTLPATGRDSTVWYWRVRFQAPAPDEDASWVTSSFRIIAGRTAGGWSQSHYGQFRRDQRQGVEVSAPAGRWAFSNENKGLLLRTRGGSLPAAAATFGGGVGFGITTNTLTPATVANCAINTPNLLVAVYDQRTLKPRTGLPAPAVCGQVPQQFYIFGANPANSADTLNTLNNSATRQAQLAAFLAAVPDGDYVAIVSMNRLRWPSLATVRTALGTLLGSRLVNQLQNGDPFALVAQKRAGGGRLIQELGPNLALPTPARYDQTISLIDTLRTPSTRGVITSTRIGPAKSWENLYHWIQREPGATSSYNLRLIGLDTLGRTVVLNNNVPHASTPTAALALSSISAKAYPYLQLELSMQDSVSRTAPQLREWFITYQGVPEGVVRRDLVAAAAYDPATLVQQATGAGAISFPVVFENVTPYDFGTPLRARVELRDASGVRKSLTLTAPPLLANSSVTLPVSVPVAGLFGTFTTKVTLNPTPNALPELNLFNNELTLAPFSVGDNNVPPTLDVAFDGRHILNGELVSPVPVINIQLSDEDKFRPITDRTAFTVTLRKPGAATATLIDLNGPDISFSVSTNQGSVARLEYQPGKGAPLPDGVYTLEVQGRDPSNASAGVQNFQVKFEVVNASKITNVYPYPNPVISKARFVFTITGQELPRNMKIQVMTLTGRVVREIFMSELGPLHIGNNITDFAWDGTDSFGDRLANGTYLYRVALDDPNGQFGHRDTAGDKAFKNDWGKLVLMR